MTNNLVSVGHSNKGNVCGGNLTINNSLPCKNIELFRQASETVQRHILAGLLTQNTTESPRGNVVTVGNDNAGNVAGKNINLK